MNIRFNYPYATGTEVEYIQQAIANGRLAGDGEFTHKCEELLAQELGAKKVLLTHSCTAALEMAAILIDIKPGDEIIMPSYTFVSTANAFVLRGGVPVFVDIRRDTLNIDENKIEESITDKTKAICVVHYAGVGCEMDVISDIAKKHGLYVIEDAAQAVGAKYKNKKLGALGDLAAVSFHETKNIQSGEGGALIINNNKFIERAEIIREKGTDRSKYFRNEVDKYTWVDIGSSYLPSELVSAYLLAQLEEMKQINAMRMKVWNKYNSLLMPLVSDKLSIQTIPEHCMHNAHMFYIMLGDADHQSSILEFLKARGVGAVFHYIPLHSSHAAKKYSRISSPLKVTEDIYNKIVRLPLWPGLESNKIEYITSQIEEFINGIT